MASFWKDRSDSTNQSEQLAQVLQTNNLNRARRSWWHLRVRRMWRTAIIVLALVIVMTGVWGIMR